MGTKHHIKEANWRFPVQFVFLMLNERFPVKSFWCICMEENSIIYTLVCDKKTRISIPVQENREIPQKAHRVYPSLPSCGVGSAKLGYQYTHGICPKYQLVLAFPSAKQTIYINRTSWSWLKYR
jgi:hypothetical protein